MSVKSAPRIAMLALAGALLAGLCPPSAARAADAQPHAWLFGAWAGGVFPAPDHMTPAQCQANTSLAITKDVVIHRTLAHPGAIQNLIVSVRGTPDGTIFMLAPPQDKPEVIAGVPEDLGFGCPSDNILRIVRIGPNEIQLPDCTGFPAPLVRCGPPR